MRKGYILVDVPESCRCVRGDEKGCQFGGMVCLVSGRDVMKYVSEGTKPDWCPIREFPEKMEVCGKYPQPGKPMPSYRIGWNDCLKSIINTDQDERDNAKDL